MACSFFSATSAQPIEEATGAFYPAASAPASAPALAPASAPAARAAASVDLMPQAIAPVQEPIALPMAVAPAQPAGPPVVAVLDFLTNTLSRQDVAALSEALWAQIGLPGTVRLLPRDLTRRWLIANDLHPFMPYGPHVPMTRVLQGLNAQYLVVGSIDRIDNAYALELDVYGTASEVPLLKEAGVRFATLDEMLAAMSGLAEQTLGAASAASGVRLASSGRAIDWSRAGESRTSGQGARPVSTAVRSAAPGKTRVGSGARIVESGEEAAASRSEENAKPQAPASSKPAAIVSLPPDRTGVGPLAPANPEPAATPKPAPAATPKPTPAATPAATPALAAAAVAEKGAAAGGSAKANQLLEEVKALDKADPARIPKLEEALKLDPENKEATQQLGFDYFRAGRFADCAALCDRALKQTPGDSQLLMIKGSAQFSLEKYKEAIESCRASLAADPTNHYSLYNLALSLEKSGSPEAIAAWRDYLEKAASDPDQQALLPDARQRLEALQKKGE